MKGDLLPRTHKWFILSKQKHNDDCEVYTIINVATFQTQDLYVGGVSNEISAC